MQIPMDSELPLGLGMALARNPAAMAAFTGIGFTSENSAEISAW